MTSIRACVIVPAVLTALAVTFPRTADAQSPAAPASLYERLGGLPAISLVVSDFMDVFVQDPVIMGNEAVRQRKTADAAPYITYQVTTLVCEATGGPCSYTGLAMTEAHRGLRVTAGEWDRMVEIFSATLQRHNVGEAETQELFAILGPTRDEIVGH
jgi:hemoglobin